MQVSKIDGYKLIVKTPTNKASPRLFKQSKSLNAMKITVLIFIILTSLNGRCSEETHALKELQSMHYAGSTPGDSLIKAILGIPIEKPIDFIRWDLVLRNEGHQTFILNIHYGISQPNTRGFMAGDETRSYEGDYINSTVKTDPFNKEVFSLVSDSFKTGNLSLVKMGNRLLHILQPDSKLMVGTGGWSYTLSQTGEPVEESSTYKSLIPSGDILKDSALQIVFDGRTPCKEISEIYKLSTAADCFKLKWRLTLNRDPVTGKPSTYKLERADIRNVGSIEGKWTINNSSDSNVIIYQLDPDQPDKSLSILVGDENVLFFLDRNNRLFTGNENFSYTLNRRNPV